MSYKVSPFGKSDIILNRNVSREFRLSETDFINAQYTRRKQKRRRNNRVAS